MSDVKAKKKDEAPPQKAEAPPEAEAQPAMTCGELLRRLRESGSPEKRLAALAALPADAPGAEGYEQLRAAGVQRGTLRKAGQFLYGPTFEPEDESRPAVPEEVMALRKRVADLERDNKSQSAELRALRLRTQHLEKQVKEKTDEISYLNASYRPQAAAERS